MRIAIAQLDPITGAFDDNLATVIAFTELAADAGAELVVFPAFALDGDFSGVLRGSQAFTDAAASTLESLSRSAELPLLIGCVAADPQCAGLGMQMAHLVHDGSYESFPLSGPGDFGTFKLGGLDFQVLLAGSAPHPRNQPDVTIEYADEPYRGQVSLDAWQRGLDRNRARLQHRHAYIAHVSAIGGADERVSRGASYALAPGGEMVARCCDFASDFVCFEAKGRLPITLRRLGASASKAVHRVVGSPLHILEDRPVASDWRALVLATHDYLSKNGFTDCVIGLSGGIDSALVATIAVDAIGPEHVHGVLMPGPFSSEGSITDATALASNLGLDVRTIPIGEPFEALCTTLGPLCGGKVDGVARENLQARIRAVYLMTLSNTFGWVLLNTGNKSEAAMGFSTLYGDTAGAFAPLGDVYKTRVFELARYRDTLGAVIPQAIIDKPPSAELYDGQRDDDRLPPYEVLDPILAAHVEGGMGRAELVEAGFDAAIVDSVLATVSRFEFKRRQEPLAPQISSFSFSERAWPLTNRFIDKER